MAKTNLKTERLQLVLSPADKAALEQWRDQQPDKPSMSAAVRRLMYLGMKAKG